MRGYVAAFSPMLHREWREQLQKMGQLPVSAELTARAAVQSSPSRPGCRSHLPPPGGAASPPQPSARSLFSPPQRPRSRVVPWLPAEPAIRPHSSSFCLSCWQISYILKRDSRYTCTQMQPKSGATTWGSYTVSVHHFQLSFFMASVFEADALHFVILTLW